MTHVIKTPTNWENITGLRDFLSERFSGDGFRFISDDSIDTPSWYQSSLPSDLVMNNKETGKPCNFPAIDEINNAIKQFVEKVQ